MQLFTKAKSETIDNEKMFVASDEVEDRQGEVIMQDGWDLVGFKKNPVVQWAHDSNEPAIARAEKIGFKMVNGKKKLVYQPVFHRKTPMSNYIADLVDAGIITMSSVGFKPIEQEDNKYIKAELLEISLVNVGANQNAVRLGISKGYDQKIIKAVMPDFKFDKKEIKEEKMEIENKSVINYTKYPLSTSDVWDSAAETKDASVDDLKKICAWCDGEKSELKGSYKLPHHELSGYKTNWHGVAAGMAALMGARGGVLVPDADKAGIYAHLSKHYKEFDKEAPPLKSANEIIDKYIENIGADEKIINVMKIVNTFIEEFRADTEEKKVIAEQNTDFFEKDIKKRFEDLELNIQGLQEGFVPGDTGLEQRLMNLEANVEKIANDIRKYLSSQSENEKGDTGRHTETGEKKESDKDKTHRLAMKVLNKSVEILNKTK